MKIFNEIFKFFPIKAASETVTCSCTGNGRCRTFDGLAIEYRGFCNFLMLEHHSDVGDIQVWMKNYNPFPRGNLWYPGKLEVVLNGKTLVMERKIRPIGSLVSLWVC